ncbi:NPR2-domain-containing protein [Macrolepiota fuliginosa MF-IS2]|uniref:NPR2-domain-containing protein n=1 Tax=Macrolepiota fuliginosa MF-IS2 TaxID=1400762 RepID=A0A9P5XRY2_9AGAR|nr:NPR2-domain-containing protein [Macrolepiota fuliginosa MF-IS2]
MPPLWHWAFRMPDGGDSFLPRIQSVFYAVFDVRQGPKIVYQVPEGLISSSGGLSFTGSPSVPPTPSIELSSPLFQSPTTQPPSSHSSNGVSSRTSSTSMLSPLEFRPPYRNPSSDPVRSGSAQRALFNFDDIHKYVIPPSALCGRLVICSTQNHRIIGLPVALKGRQYERNFFRYNICFVFDRGADLSCYDPIVRKVSRVLTACEEESRFLSMPSKSYPIHAVLEQLYEDLNSYAETSIPIDQFNSIELKIFPFYPNPPPVQDWMVPLALINLSKRVEDNWDLTMAKVCKYIDGTNHVSRIAYLADCDIALTRQAISHLLYYQVVMTIDIFQYSNMYTLRKSIQWLADEIHVKEECGPYVTKPGNSIPDWPKLLHLYSRLKPGKTVYEWKEEYEVEKLGIDIRRFTSFGVIKGFLRRVHRWPVYLAPEPSSQPHKSAAATALANINASFELPNTFPRKRGHSLSNVSLRFPFTSQPPLTGDPTTINATQIYRTTRPQTAGASTVTFPNPEHAQYGGISTDAPSATITQQLPPQTTTALSSAHRARRASAAEKILEHLRNRDKSAAAAAAQQQFGGAYASPRNSWIPFQHRGEHQQYSSQYSQQETSSSLTPPAYDTHLRTGGGGGATSGATGGDVASRSVTPTHTLGNLPTPTMTTKSLHGHGHGHGHAASGSGGGGGGGSGAGLGSGIGPGAALVSGHTSLPQPQLQTQESPSRGLTALNTMPSTGVTAAGGGGMGGGGGIVRQRPERRQSLNSAVAPPPSPVMPKANLATPSRPRMSRSPSATQVSQVQGPGQGAGYSGGSGGYSQGQGQGSGLGSQGKSGLGGGLEYPPQLTPLLDGEHHTDQLCTKFEVGWPLLERWLELIGNDEIGSDEGRVVIIYR